MLSGRRASLLSASNTRRRVRHENITAFPPVNALLAAYAIKYSLLLTPEDSSMLMRDRVTFSTARNPFTCWRAMHSASHQTSPTNATLSCRWKKGHPVTGRSHIPYSTNLKRPSFMQNTSIKLEDVGSTLHAGSSRARLAAEVQQRHPASDQMSGLWHPSLPLRFAPTPIMRAPSPADLVLSVGDSKVPGQDIDYIPDIDSTQSYSEEVRIDTPQSSAASGSEESAEENVSEVEDEDKDTTEVEEEPEPLSYQIPEDKLRAAMLALKNTRASFWSTKLYKGPNGESLPVHYCKTFDVAERVAQYFLTPKVLGFDIEWKVWAHPASIKQNVSLIQLASENRIALFHVALFAGTTAEQLMPPTLKAILESPDILKVGVAVKGDFTRLEKYFGIQPQGVFELSRLHNVVQWYNVNQKKVTHRLISLAAQVHEHLQLPLYKGGELVDEPEVTSSVRESDWSLPLDLQQIQYAAADAYAGVRLYDILERKRIRLKPTPPSVQICDYDKKIVPKVTSKPKKSRTKNKQATKIEEEEEDRSEEDDGEHEKSENCETATEELLDSHQVEDNISSDSAQDSVDVNLLERGNMLHTGVLEEGAVQGRRRVGRPDFNEGPDPAYPILPTDLHEDGVEDQCRSAVDAEPVSTNYNSEEDDYADPELEEALQALDVDHYGRLINRPVDLETIEPNGESHQTFHFDGRLSEFTLEDILETVTPLLTAEDSEPITDVLDQDLTEKKTRSTAKRTVRKLNQQALDEQALGLSSEESSASFDESLVVDGRDNLVSPVSPVPQLDTKSATTPPTSVEYNSATAWAQHYIKSTIPSPLSTTPSHIRATIPHLRAYHMWHHQHLPLEEIRVHLRDPPLSQSTVTSYIMQAISLERLEYEGTALKEVMMTMPVWQRMTRWKGWADKVGATASE